MIRVSGGFVRGRRILTPGDMIRPTQEKVRQALFSILADRVPGCRFLDLFAGSGAVGLEAWSRGAGFVCWVEQDRKVASVLKRNVADVCVSGQAGGERATLGGETRVVIADAVRFIGSAAVSGPYDIIFADPPYAMGGREACPRKILQALIGGSTLAPDGVLVVEQGAEAPPIECAGWALVREKVYGGTLLRFLKK